MVIQGSGCGDWYMILWQPPTICKPCSLLPGCWLPELEELQKLRTRFRENSGSLGKFLPKIYAVLRHILPLQMISVLFFLYKLLWIGCIFTTLYKLYYTAVSAGHQSKSCSVYKKCEDIFFLEPFYFVTFFFAKVISEDIWGSPAKFLGVVNHLNPPKQKSLKNNKKK